MCQNISPMCIDPISSSMFTTKESMKRGTCPNSSPLSSLDIGVDGVVSRLTQGVCPASLDFFVVRNV
jgi:hypothetical protein